MSAEIAIDRDRLVDWASRAIGTPSFTGDEQAMAELMRDDVRRAWGCRCSGSRSRTGARTCSAPGRATGGGPSLMFNGHMDTSYSGREPWLAGVRGFQPERVRQGRAASSASASRT